MNPGAGTPFSPQRTRSSHRELSPGTQGGLAPREISTAAVHPGDGPQGPRASSTQSQGPATYRGQRGTVRPDNFRAGLGVPPCPLCWETEPWS